MINYNRLWTLISEYNLTKTEFMNQLGVSSATFAKLSSNQPVTMEVLEKNLQHPWLLPGQYCFLRSGRKISSQVGRS